MERLKTIAREELKAKMDRGDDFVLLEVLSDRASRPTSPVPKARDRSPASW